MRAQLNHPTTLKRKFDAAHKVAAVDPNAPKKLRSEKEYALALTEAEAKIKALEARVRSDGSLFDIDKTSPDQIADILVEETIRLGRFTKASQINASLTRRIAAKKKLLKARAG